MVQGHTSEYSSFYTVIHLDDFIFLNPVIIFFNRFYHKYISKAFLKSRNA